jgi:DNA-binding Lrp family transcriptional regulator
MSCPTEVCVPPKEGKAMFQAYVLVKVTPGSAQEVFQQVKTMDSVVEVELVYGEYDLIMKVEKNLPEALDDFVFNKLRQIEGVEATMTCICAKSIK